MKKALERIAILCIVLFVVVTSFFSWSIYISDDNPVISIKANDKNRLTDKELEEEWKSIIKEMRDQKISIRDLFPISPAGEPDIDPKKDLAPNLFSLRQRIENILDQGFLPTEIRFAYERNHLKAPSICSLYIGAKYNPFIKHYYFCENQVKVKDVVKTFASIGVFIDKTSNSPEGSLFLVSSQGHVLTAAHVLNSLIENDGGDKSSFSGRGLEILIGDKKYSLEGVKVLSRPKCLGCSIDPEGDIALLQIPSLINRPYLKLSKNAVEKGAKVFLIGYPDIMRDKVCSFGEVLWYSKKYPRVFATDNEARLGNSGGSLVNEKGEVVGLIFAVVFSGGGSAITDFTERGYYLKVDVLQKILQDNGLWPQK
ncbi:MAG: serine protease [Patescibacteria group bacterium]